ncbi:glycosyltransferase family A protein [uncultured Aquabacterium sp.]|uniref:glycosyltransferase family 2 protein n=1 Tax=uncultured Aquabacterium sp. TaxID=158753 RepID=UPI0025EE27CE|nr:glycosyltransferase family A protein [uncultured Aquabacterium sp.]
MNFRKLSVVIPNYNYESYIADAIESALSIDWPDVEVIVVDDGSTDNSRAVIERYRGRVQSIFQENKGQVGACNAGFAASTGDAVLFLDSDDFVEPSVAREADAVWTDDTSKVQFQMRCVSGDGEPLGSYLPQYHVVPSAQEVRAWVTTTSAYPTPPGSGNIYSRRYLEKIFPLDHSGGRAADSCCIAAAPFMGDVLTVPKALVSYRIHGKNDGAFSELDVQRFSREVTRASLLYEYARKTASKVGIQVPSDSIRYSLTLLPYRVASLKLAPSMHPWSDDSVLRLLKDLLVGLRRPQGLNGKACMAVAAWSVAVLASPRRVAEKLILWRFAAGSRPKVLMKALRLAGVIR